ncbi:hypothetical protein L1887_21739 [Cichorium endivia]|nr:hypothetical protein L1887_21739 [Cichorium endivia]
MIGHGVAQEGSWITILSRVAKDCSWCLDMVVDKFVLVLTQRLCFSLISSKIFLIWRSLVMGVGVTQEGPLFIVLSGAWSMAVGVFVLAATRGIQFHVISSDIVGGEGGDDCLSFIFRNF